MRSPVHLTVRALGLVLVLAAAWGGIVAFVGPIFDFTVRGTTSSWVWNQHHATLYFAPGLAGVVGGLLMLAGARRSAQSLGAALAAVAGAWFAIGPSVEPTWASAPGSVVGTSSGATMRALEAIGFNYGTGAFIVTLAALALGMLAAAPRLVAPAAVGPVVEEVPPEDQPVTAEQVPGERTAV